VFKEAYGNGNGLCVLEAANGIGIIISCFLNKFALFRHFSSGVKGFIGLTKFVDPIPNKKVSISTGLWDNVDQGI
jgi:hypothetical protein